MYSSNGEAQEFESWSFSGSVAPKEAWEKRFFRLPLCCGANLDPEKANGKPFPQTYSPFNPTPETEGLCFSEIARPVP
jgi:hypothetical protein